MNYKHFYFILLICFNLKVKAQTREDFVNGVLSFTNPEWFQSVAQPGKNKYSPQRVDSILIEYRNKVDRKTTLLEVSVKYKGEFKNGLFHGKGKLLITQYSYPYQRDKPYVFSYEGDFENGAADGKGFLNYSWWYSPRDMNAVLVKMNCQVDFVQGVGKSGLIRYDHTLNDVTILTTFYSGELYMKNGFPVLHGLGILYVSKNSPGSEMAKRSPGIDGGFYAGNFFYGEYTGFAICNYLESFDNDLTNLLVGIVGKGELLHTLSWLPVNKDWSYREELPRQTKSEAFSQVFGDYKDVKKGIIYLDKENKYTGGIKNNLPHGIGYVENGNGFYDIAFWNAGKRLTVKEVLGRLLPDSSMVQAKKIKKKFAFELNVPNGTKTTETIYDAAYFGKLNQGGNPLGWGLLLCIKESGQLGDTTTYSTSGTVIGNFNGTNQLAGFHENQFMNAITDQDEKQAFVVGLRYNDLFSSYAFIPKYKFFVKRSVNEYYSNETPAVAVTATESFKEDMDAFQAKRANEMTYISSRKSIEVKTVHLSSVSGNSYVETSVGKIALQELTADQVGYGDFIFYDDVFYEVNRMGMLNDYVAPHPSNQHLSVSGALKNQKGYVLKGYWMAAKYEPDSDKVCVFCGGKPTGKSTYTGVGYTGRYENNVYNNNSGGFNIVSKPITTITTVTVDNKPCEYCKGVEAKRRVKANVVRD